MLKFTVKIERQDEYGSEHNSNITFESEYPETPTWMELADRFHDSLKSLGYEFEPGRFGIVNEVDTDEDQTSEAAPRRKKGKKE
jgi:hypothetical protein